MSELSLEQIAESPYVRQDTCNVLAREIIALRTRAEGRLDSHNRIMQSIVRRVRALEGGGVECTCGIVPQPPGPNHGPRCPAEVAPKTIELLRGMVDRAKQQQDKAERAAVENYQRAETAERERDTWEAEFAKLAERRRVDISPLVRERDQARRDEAYVAGQNRELGAKLSKQREDFARSVNALTADRDAARASVERLREALVEIADVYGRTKPGRIAQAALEDA